MPCTVDTSYEDNLFARAFREHHKIVETILEDWLEDKIDRSQALAKLKEAKTKLAHAYLLAYRGNGYNQDEIRKRAVAMLGKYGTL